MLLNHLYIILVFLGLFLKQLVLLQKAALEVYEDREEINEKESKDSSIEVNQLP